MKDHVCLFYYCSIIYHVRMRPRTVFSDLNFCIYLSAFSKNFWLQSTINGAKQSLFSKFPTVNNLRAFSFRWY